MQKEKAASALESELLARGESEARMVQILEALSDNDRKALETVLEKMRKKNSETSTRSTHMYSYKWLADTLTKHGHPITKDQIRHYMKRKNRAEQ